MEFLMDPSLWVGFLTLVVLEIVLGIDNLVFIAILADKLPPEQRDKARVIGLSLALIMRLGLLTIISWLVTLTNPLVTIFNWTFSGRDLILLIGGLFLVYKAVTELHEKLEGRVHVETNKRSVVYAGFWVIVAQIIVLDAVFSLDSVITAVGMVDNIYVMMAAVTVAVLVMLVASKPLTAFVNRHPTVVILCLSFLLLIGISLIAEGFGFHIPKGYIYAGIGVAILIEAFNQFSQRNMAKQEAQIPFRHRTADAILRLMGGREVSVEDRDLASNDGFVAEERYMIGGVLTLAERSVSSIMTPRRDISWINLNDDPEKIREQILSVPHSLFPVCRGELDKVITVAHAKELMDSLDNPEDLRQLLKRNRPICIFAQMKVIDAINTLRSSKGSLVLVTDEFGVIQGLISPLDVFEAIAGEFPDADEQPDLVQIDERTWHAKGAADLYQLELALEDVDLVNEHSAYYTVSGLMLDQLQDTPRVGATIEFEGIRFEVLEIQDQRIVQVKITYPIDGE